MPQGSANKARGVSGSHSGPGSGSGSGSGAGGGSGAGSGSSMGISDGSKSRLGSPGFSAGRDRSEAQKAMDTQIIGPFLDHGGCELRLVNVTATANMGCPIDLKTVVMRARNAEYNPKRFSACVSGDFVAYSLSDVSHCCRRMISACCCLLLSPVLCIIISGY